MQNENQKFIIESRLEALKNLAMSVCSNYRLDLLKPILDYLEANIETPASCKLSNHGCFHGGLIAHIYDLVMVANSASQCIHEIGDPGVRVEYMELNEEKGRGRDSIDEALYSVTRESIITVALIHDLNKIKDFSGNSHYLPNIKKDGSLSRSSPYSVNPEYDIFKTTLNSLEKMKGGHAESVLFSEESFNPLDGINTGVISLALAEHVSPGIVKSLSPYERQAIVFHGGIYEGFSQKGYRNKESPLALLIHFSDMLCSVAAN